MAAESRSEAPIGALSCAIGSTCTCRDEKVIVLPATIRTRASKERKKIRKSRRKKDLIKELYRQMYKFGLSPAHRAG